MKLFGGFNFEKNNKIESSFEDFAKKENGILNKANGFLMELAPEKFKKPAAAMLTALALFAEASSAYAEDSVKENEAKIEEVARSGSTFDWKKIVEKLEISAGGKVENIPEFKGEAVGYYDTTTAEFYRDLSVEESSEVFNVFSDAINNVDDSESFFKFLNEKKEDWDDRQKALFLQELGHMLGQTYNFDMIEKGEYVKVSEEAMYKSLKSLFSGQNTIMSGVCTNIHVFITKTARSLGVESWLQSGKMGESNHAWSGITLENEGGKQVAFINYGDLVTTGTLNYKDALGVAERYMEGIGTFNSFVGDGKILKVESRAQEEIKKASGIEDAGDRMEKGLKDGEIKRENALEINLSPEIKDIKLTKDHLVLSFYDYNDVHNNPFQALENMSAIRGGLRLGGQKLGLEANATVLNMNIKDLEGGAVERNEFIGSIMADYIDSHKFNKEDYGQFEARWGATLNAAISLNDANVYSGMGESSIGGRLIYINPNETGKFYIGVSGDFRAQSNDFEDQELAIENVGRNLTIGSSIKVQEARVVNLEAVLKNLDWGNVYKIKGGLMGEKLAGDIEYEKDDSRFERFIPSGEKISASVEYRATPKYSINISGFESTEKYDAADTIKAYGGEVKFIINMF